MLLTKLAVHFGAAAHPGKWTGTQSFGEDQSLLASGEAQQCPCCKEVLPRRLIFCGKCPNCETKIV